MCPVLSSTASREHGRGRRLLVLAALVGTFVACGGGSYRRFPLREPMWIDQQDLRWVSAPCRSEPSKKGERELVCRPESYESSLAWDALDNTMFLPLTDTLSFSPSGEAWNVNAVDEVPDSSWWTNRWTGPAVAQAAWLSDAASRRQVLSSGSCEREHQLDPDAPDGSWVIDQGKPNGSTPGFRINVKGKGKFMLKADDPAQPERSTAAQAVGARFYHAIGFHTPCDTVVLFRPSLLKLTPGLTSTDNTGATKAFDQAALAAVLGKAVHVDGLVRMAASEWLPGRVVGPFTYRGVREDDPNDVVPHEERRELRGGRVLAAWLNHFDAREQNTMTSWIARDRSNPDSSPGYLRHYYLDLSDCFGSAWEWEGMTRRLGHAYYLDFSFLVEDFLTLGIIERPWDRVRKQPGAELFGYFSARDFVPEEWRGGYPNPAFDRMTEHDAAWMARLIARLERDDVDALVSAGRFSLEEHHAYLVEQLLLRRRAILQRWLTKLSPLADVTVQDAAARTICARDLARESHVFDDARFRYAARMYRLGDDGAVSRAAVELTTLPTPDAHVCVRLPTAAVVQGPDDAVARYRLIDVTNGQSRGPLRVHLYDLGLRGVRIVGTERPDDTSPPH